MLWALLFVTAAGCSSDTPEAASAADGAEAAPGGVAIAIHGGAGTILRSNMTPETEAAYRAKLEEALRTGYDLLQEGASSTDAVVATIQVMEASPLFNSAVGAVYTADRTHELDASIMDGATRNAGAVAGVKTVKSPIALARLVMDKSVHVMLSGEGAAEFARQNGLEEVDNSYFDTERRLEQLERAQARERGTAEADLPPMKPLLSPGADRFGTVGCVALDSDGNLAAGTSTGGMTNKRFGRIGDSPVIGAGTYADNETVAISSTGWGEYFIRGVIAHDIASRIGYLGEDVGTAARTVIMDKLTEMGGTGGVIAMDGRGNVAMPFNTEGMYRGTIDAEGRLSIAIYGDEQ
jgi:beta-aspartyl-peptidase (threonine type)